MILPNFQTKHVLLISNINTIVIWYFICKTTKNIKQSHTFTKRKLFKNNYFDKHCSKNSVYGYF
jgi:hypothetical protein